MRLDARNELFLRRARKVIVEPGADKQPPGVLASLLKNFEGLGFTCSPTLVDRLTTLSEQALTTFHASTRQSLKGLAGAGVSHVPMYPNFPAQVMEASAAELYLNALLHYAGDLVGARIMPSYEKVPREPFVPERPLEVIELGTEEELAALGKALLGSKTSLSKTDRGDVIWFLREYRERLDRVIPAELPHKENLVVIASALLRHTQAADIVLNRYFRTATDVLRLAAGLSNQDVSLAESPRFRSFRRPERRLLLALLDRIERPIEDMNRHRGAWIRLGERLHPGEYRASYPRAAAAFDWVRSDERFVGFNAKVEKSLASGDVSRALLILSKRPGELARRIDQLLRKSPAQAFEVIEAFEGGLSRVSVPVVLQVLAHFRHRADPRSVRVFLPKSTTAKFKLIPNQLPALDEGVCGRVVEVCRADLVRRFSERPKLGRVYVDEALRDYLVPFSQRSASRALRTVVRGSRLPFGPGGTIRFFIWWKEGQLDGVPTGRVDIDLSAVLFDTDWRYLEHLSYTKLVSAKYRAAHSGDITSAPNGAAEFIDIDVESLRRFGARFVLMGVFAFTRQAFRSLPECFGGWMMRSEPQSGEIFEPSTIENRIDLSADTRIAVPVILDVQERRAIWADLALTDRSAFRNNLENNDRGLARAGRAISELVKPDLYELFTLHARARGELVSRPEDAETVFSVARGITPFSIEKITSELL